MLVEVVLFCLVGPIQSVSGNQKILKMTFQFISQGKLRYGTFEKTPKIKENLGTFNNTHLSRQ